MATQQTFEKVAHQNTKGIDVKVQQFVTPKKEKLSPTVSPTITPTPTHVEKNNTNRINENSSKEEDVKGISTISTQEVKNSTENKGKGSESHSESNGNRGGDQEKENNNPSQHANPNNKKDN